MSQPRILVDDVTNDDNDITREPEMVRAYRDFIVVKKLEVKR